jgi:GntR family transcriptional regulator/MocR family aminotransferase
VSTWELTITPAAPDGLPLFLRIARAVVGDIRRGRLRPGDSLPGSRTLARTLGVNRNTILSSYRELLAEGWVTTTPAGSTCVSRELPNRGHRPKPTLAAPRDLVGFAVAPPLALGHPPSYPPGTLVLAKGAPDVRLLPTTELARAFRRALAREGRALLAYGDPRGHPRLRAALVTMLSATRGITADTGSVLITHGSQMALDLAARALLQPGDVVVVEALGHPFVRSTIELAGARLISVPVDRGGLCVDALPAIAERHRLRAIVVTPHHQFPTTSVMPAARRLQLLAFAGERRIAVIEDDYDHEFHYDGRPVLPLASSDPAGVVVYVGTLSKILAPGLRVGFAVAPAPVIARMASLRIATDIQGDLLIEAALADLFDRGELGRHVRRMRRIYRARRDALVEALHRELGSDLSFEVPSGGMALWARAAAGIDVDRWAERALDFGVAFNGGRMYDAEGAYQPCIRLGFTFLSEAELEEAARRMAAALAALRREGGQVGGRVSPKAPPRAPGRDPVGAARC